MFFRFVAVVLLWVSVAFWLTRHQAPSPAPLRPPALPVYFIENRGQLDSRVSYYVHGRQHAIYLTSNSLLYALTASSRRVWLQVEFPGASPHPAMDPSAPTTALVSYFHGAPQQWKTALPTYSTVTYSDLWPGIDLELTGPSGWLKYHFHLRPGADPRLIRLAYHGVTSLSITPGGSLHIDTALGALTEDKPVAWQDTPHGRQPVAAAFRLNANEVHFELGAYNHRLPLTIDPVVFLSAGFLGGLQDDTALGVAVDQAGNAYLTGSTYSSQASFPVTVGPDSTFNGGSTDAFIAKVNPTGTALLYAGFLGGSGNERGEAIAVDAAGCAYITGYTTSTQATFPVLAGPDTTYNGGSMDAFVAKINPTGATLLYAGYVGGAASDDGTGIAVDPAGNAYIAGYTASTQTTFPVHLGPDLSYNGGPYDAFVAKVNPTGTALVYAGFLGGEGDDSSTAIALDSAGSAYLTGITTSTASFPVLQGPDLTANGQTDAFVAKVNAAGTGLVYAGFLGGAANEIARAIAVDAAGCAYLAGSTESTQATFPVLTGPDLTFNGSIDGFVAKVNATGTALVYAGFLGGAANEDVRAIAVDQAGNAYITGDTNSSESSFPVLNGPDLSHNGAYSGDYDAFVTKVNATGSKLVYSGFVGGSSYDAAQAIAVDASGHAFITGLTYSTQATFPVTAGPDVTFNGAPDAFLVKLSAFPSTAGPLMALRNGFNAIETSTFPSPNLRNAGGNFRLNPALALAASGRVFLIGRDSSVGVWLNILNPNETYSGWQFAGGNSPGQPALAAAGETAWIAVRDPWNSYSVRSYNPITGFGSWTWLQGILATDPQIAACPNGDVYLTGRDNFNGVWTRRYRATTSSWQAWRLIGGIISGTPAITCGADNAAYIAARDPSNNMWLARVFEESTASWHYGAGIFQSDLQIAAQGNLIHVFGLAAGVPWYRTWLIGTGWQGWTSPGGVLTHFAPAVYGSHVFLTGQDASGNLWWWSSLGNSWSSIGNKNVAPGSLFSTTPR
jgi:hypothetical protein